MTEWTVNNKLNDWYRKQYHIKLPKNYETKSRLYFTAAYSPFELFSTGSVGLWLDPSDVANLTWRRNLLTFSEQFSNSAWTKTSILTLTSDATTAPDGTATADLITETATVGLPTLRYIPATGATSGTYSVYAKANGRNHVCLSIYGGAAFKYSSAVYDLTTGAVTKTQVGTGAVLSATGMTPVGAGWYRLSMSYTITAPVVIDPYIHLVGSATPTIDDYGTPVTYTGNGTNGAYLWGAQLELGSVATDYQRISDVNTEVIERFPSATMYQDAAGTTAVTTPGQPVGLRLDKSKGLALGAELVGTLAAYANATFATVGGVTTVTCAANGSYGITLGFSGVAGKTYAMTFEVLSNSASRVLYGWTSLSSSINLNAGTTTGIKSGSVLASANGSGVIAILGATAGETFSIRNISVRELAGNHATQSVLASRPVYGIEPAGGRRNLLTFSEDYSNAVWSKSLVTVTANAILAPDGISTTDTIIPSTATNFHYLNYAATVVSTTSYVVSFYAKNGGYGFIRYYDGTSNAVYNLSGAGAITDNSNGASTITSVGDGWYRCTKTIVTASTTRNISIYPQNVAGMVSYAGDGTSGIYLWGAQLELGSTATPYQRVTSAFDVTEAGVQSCHYVQYDGINHGMITNSIDFTATDKMSVFAGVRKISDANAGVFAELGATVGTTNGSFLVAAPGTAPSYYALGLRQTAYFARNATSAALAAPVSNVVSVLFDSAQVGVAEIGFRANGSVEALTTAVGTDSGTGNFGNHKLNIGRRGNDQITPTLPFYGRDYGIVIVGKATTADEITATERWLSGKTGFYAPIITGVPTIGVS